jgi:hypothetical protein
MSKSTTKTTTLPDPTTMGEEELRAYVAKLEKALTVTASKVPSTKPWLAGEKREVYIPKTATNDAVTINGKKYVGRMRLDFNTYQVVTEMIQRANRSELSRMQQRGNMANPHEIQNDDLMSRNQPVNVANL